MKRLQHTGNQGFTLVEMLVVISIIGVLAGLVTVAAMAAKKKANQYKITQELSQMDMSLKSMRDKFGAYPPDGTYQDGVTTAHPWPNDFERYFRRAFPRADLASEFVLLRQKFPGANGFQLRDVESPINFSPQTMMVFWLGGMPEDPTNPKSRLIGFSKDPIHPLSDLTSTSRIGPFYDFQSANLRFPPGSARTFNIFRACLPPVSTPTECPYVYFRAEAGPSKYEYFIPPVTLPVPANPDPTVYRIKAIRSGSAILVRPYWNIQEQGFVNPKSYQILCAGLDGQFGVGNAFSTGFKPLPYPTIYPTEAIADYDPANLDDQANFITGVIKDAQ
jgi:prepilin-type N-terminal cleavage/methylation domain-containing protein